MVLNIYTDGGARGNPGPSGYGWVIYDDNKNIIIQEKKFLGIKTNNEAEYSALIGVLVWLKDNVHHYHLSQINFYSDSQLLVRQMQGIYKVKSSSLRVYYQTASTLLSSLNLAYTFNDIRREYNKIADSLANQAMDSAQL